MIRNTLIGALVSGASLAGTPASAQGSDPVENEVVVTGKYLADRLSTPQHTQPLVDTPQTITVVEDDLMAEQGRRTLRDAMRNITGISFQAGEGNPPGGSDAFNVRGFSARDDVFVDGIRDPGNYFRDPFYAERIEVTKGPASAFAGRGNVGGTVNIVTRQPVLAGRISGELGVGTDNFFRGTFDVNQVVDEAAGIAVRLTAMGHSADEPGRDHVFNRRWAVAPSIGFGLDGDTSFIVNYLHLEQNDRPDAGLPNGRNPSLAGSGFEGRVAPVHRTNFYGYSTDYRTVATDSVTGRFEHRFSDSVTIRNTTRFARVHNDQLISSPRFVGSVTTLGPATQAVGNRKPRDQVDRLFINQTSLTAKFATGGIDHTLVIGGELVDESNENRRRLDANGPVTNLFDPVLQAAAPIAYNGTRARTDVTTQSLYIFDTIELGEQWNIVAGVRHDWVKTRARGIDDSGTAPGFVVDFTRSDSEWSGNAALVFKPSSNSSIYVAYGTAFEPGSGAEVVQLAGGNNNAPVTAANFFVDPETSRAWEAGAKIDLMQDTLQLSGAVFQITRDNARTPGINPGDPAVVLDGEQRVSGFELQAVGRVTSKWNLFAGYSYLDGKVTRSNRPFEVGQRLDGTPEHSASIWTSYALATGFVIGGGAQHVSSRTSNIRPTATSDFVIVTPSYTVFDAFAEYDITDRIGLRANVYNIGDESYFYSFASGQSIPAAGRSATLTLTFKY
ncbi:MULTISPECIES: TonB-dependent receptor [unclassified Sphingomonas]|uniref:TonB-dependent receptor n=1 Tax=unclassified Sphingomonas TaxID=196159 RepID=UPI002151A6F8|nr:MULTISPECIES: TonB-dependent siderophore receptor [unclassified Sphingomonas]MCR5870715.1 TonB-dependent siderophore receptor [Sphingomonas sp. J344]MDK2769319.1 TonB-dependent siderophore receptor [Sphingomonas sp.]UUY00949.1 TonB-dependent siderophore receptor [Sphingomonas sp. J315]